MIPIISLGKALALFNLISAPLIIEILGLEEKIKAQGFQLIPPGFHAGVFHVFGKLGKDINRIS